jgi:hypothetical protein
MEELREQSDAATIAPFRYRLAWRNVGNRLWLGAENAGRTTGYELTAMADSVVCPSIEDCQ